MIFSSGFGKKYDLVFYKMHKNMFQHECIPCFISDVCSLKMQCFTLKQQKDEEMKTARRLSEDLQSP